MTYNTENAKITGIYQKADINHFNDRILLYFSNKTANAIPCIVPNTINGIQVQNSSWTYLSGDHLFSYGEANNTNGRNQFKTNTGTDFNNQLDALGFGSLHNSIVDHALTAFTNVDSIPKYSVGVVEINLIETMSLISHKPVYSNVKIFPNPSQNTINIEFNSQENKKGTISILSISGKTLQEQTIPAQKGVNSIKLNTERLENGMYLISINIDGIIQTRKITKL